MGDLRSRNERAKIISSLCNDQYFPTPFYIRDLEIFEYFKTGHIGNISRSQLIFPHPFGGRSFYFGGTDNGSMSVEQALDLIDSKGWNYQASNFQEDSLKQFEREVIEIGNRPPQQKVRLCKERLIKKLIAGQNSPVKSISRLLQKSEKEVIELIKNLNLEKFPASMCYVYGEIFYCGAVNAKPDKRFNLADFEQLQFLPYLDFYISEDRQLTDMAQKVVRKLGLKVTVTSDLSVITRAVRIPRLNH